MTVRRGFSARDNPSALEAYLAKTARIFQFLRPGEVDRPVRETNVPMPERTMSPSDRSIRQPQLTRRNLRRR